MNVTAKDQGGAECGRCRLVDRGPNWLFLRVERPTTTRASRGAIDLAEQVLELSEQHFVYRIVLEMDGVESVDAATLDGLDEVRERLAERGGALRLCGLREEVADAVGGSLRGWLCNHSTRHGAVVGDPSEGLSMGHTEACSES